VAHDFARAGAGNGTGRDKGNQRDFDVEKIANRGGYLPRVGKRLGISYLRNDGQRRLGVFVNLECGDAVGPDHAGRPQYPAGNNSDRGG